MGRIKLVIAALAVVGASFAAFAAPAMADNLNNCRNANGDLIRCDGQFFAPVSDFNNFNNGGLFGNGLFSPFSCFPGFSNNAFCNGDGFVNNGFNNGFDGTGNFVGQSVG
jgi:hypothetical protein